MRTRLKPKRPARAGKPRPAALAIVACLAIGLCVVLARQFTAPTAMSLALCNAAEQGDTLRVRILLALSADPNGVPPPRPAGIPPDYFATPQPYDPSAFAAVHSGHWETMKALVMRGAEVNARNHLGQTLLIAAINNSSDNPDLAESDALMQRRETAQKVKAIQFLLDHKADVNLRNTYTGMPYGGELRSDFALGDAATANNPDIINLLLSHGERVNQQSRGGITALHLAVIAGKAEAVQTLLAHGADINARTQVRKGKGATPLTLARDEKVAAILKAAGGKL